ncbi:MAG: DUF423 domain-containing protein [Pirellulaceae bacterium]|nr:DUF423 domain-containing protein [Pirellulaceae bacterium]MDP7305466.1 DUF423 domain-containing protein [Pirellulaceae bacterium]HJN10262.1 DUF423 domain-containing protein [Pirellulaceae bacterium]
MARRILLVAALMGALGVILGAFGAHGLESAVKDWGLAVDEQIQQLTIWKVAVRYQMYHALALLATGILAVHKPTKSLVVAGTAFTLGTLVFSGCLYALVLSGVKILGAVVPLGGLGMIVGWLALAVAVWRMKLD